MLIEREKINLAKLLEHYSLEFLRPSPQVYEIQIPQSEYFVNTGGKQRRRRIFFRVQFDEQEENAIVAAKQLLKTQGCRQKFSDPLILKHLYSAKFNIKDAVQRLKKVSQFHRNPIITKFDEKTIKSLQNGCIYTYGQNRSMQPIIILRADRFDFDVPIQQNFNVVYYLMLVVLGYRMVPYHAQKYITIFDLCDISFSKIPYRYLYDLLTKMNTFYCGNTDGTFVYNSSGIGTIWKVFSAFLPEYQKRKVVFIEKGKERDMLKYVEEYELQKRYGGKLDNLKEYWPPKLTNQEFNLKMMNGDQTDFYSVENDLSFFNNHIQGQSEGCCGSKHCTIY